MSPLECDQKLEQIIREFTLRIVVPPWTEFDTIWEIATRVCDQYHVGKSQVSSVTDPPVNSAGSGITSSDAACAADEPAQTHLPVAA
jgi:hypothetical protein